MLLIKWTAVICLLVLYKGAALQPLKKNSSDSLSRISFDTSRDVSDSGALYRISMKRDSQKPPRFSIHLETELSSQSSDGEVLATAIWQDKMNQTGRLQVWNKHPEVLSAIDMPL